MNTALFTYLYQLQKINAAMPRVVIFFGSYLPYALAGVLLLYLFVYKQRAFPFERRLFIVASTLLSSILAYIGILLFRGVLLGTQRPFVTLPDIKPLIDTGQAFASFPSLHTAIFFAAGMFLYFYHKRLGICYLVGAFLIGLARIVAGVHWPLDILVGIGVGALAAFIVRWFTRSIKRNL